MKLKSYLTTETVFPVIVALLSITNLINNIRSPFSLSGLVSLIGLTGAVLYFQKKDGFSKFIYIWIMAQLIIIDKEVMNQTTGILTKHPILDLSQVFKLKLGMFFKTKSGTTVISLNFVPFLYFGLFKILRISGLVGKQLTFRQFREDNRLGDIFPFTGTVTKRVNLQGEKGWLLVKTEAPFIYEGDNFHFILVKNKSEELIELKAPNQLVFVRLVQDPQDIKEGINDTDKFPFIDWALCE